MITQCSKHECYNPAIPSTSRCDTHSAKPWEGSHRKLRLPKDWDTRRKIIIRRADGKCEQCGQTDANQVDHKQAGDNHDLTNLQLLCQPCHTDKTTYEALHGKFGEEYFNPTPIQPPSRRSKLPPPF